MGQQASERTEEQVNSEAVWLSISLLVRLRMKSLRLL